MKKNHYIYLFAATTLALSACSSDGLLGDLEETATQQEVITDSDDDNAVVIEGTIADGLFIEAEEGNAGNSRGPRHINIDSSTGQITQWYSTDLISISNGTLFYTYKAKAAETSTCEFESKSGKSFITDGTGTGEGEFDAFYPATAVLGWYDNTVTSMVYAEQVYEENMPGGAMGPYMAAHATTTDNGSKAHFSFTHLCSIIDVNIAGLGLSGNVASVSIYANNQVSLAGKLRYDTEAKTLTVNNSQEGTYSYSYQSETVTVRMNTPAPASTIGTVRFFVLPTKIVGGVTITIEMEDGTYYSKHTTKDVGSSTETDLTLSGVTNGTVVKPYYKKYNFGAYDAEGITLNNWMATIPGNTKFNHLSLPGAHDAASVGCTSQTNYTRCQSLNVENLLQNGCRALDLRPYYDDADLTIYHGSYSAHTTLASVLTDVTGFLDDNPTETVFVLIAQEGGDDGNTNWQNRVWTCLNNYTSHIASHGWTGNLNPCRGKMVVIFRNTYTGGSSTGDLGCGKVGWGSSFNSKPIWTGNGSGTSNTGSLYYQDEYEYTSSSYVSEKLTNLENMLTNYIAANETNAGYIYVNNTNCIKGSSLFGTVVINTDLTTSANAVNTAVLNSSTFTNHTGRFGIMMVDFLFSSSQKGDQMYNLIRKQNYKYVYKGRSRYNRSASDDTGITISDGDADGGTVYAKER